MALRTPDPAPSAVLPLGGPAGTPGQSTYQAWLALGNTGTLADFMAAQKGVDGTDGIGVADTRIAAVAIPASTFVVDDGDGTCSIADPTNAAHRGKVLGLVVATTAQGATATFQCLGAVDGVAGAFSAASGTLYIGDGTTGRLGSLVNVHPSLSTAAWIQAVGTAASASSVNLLLGEPKGINRGPIAIGHPTQFIAQLAAAWATLPSSDPGVLGAPYRNGSFLAFSDGPPS